jgi:hypothetical protein
MFSNVIRRESLAGEKLVPGGAAKGGVSIIQ